MTALIGTLKIILTKACICQFGFEGIFTTITNIHT